MSQDGKSSAVHAQHTQPEPNVCLLHRVPGNSRAEVLQVAADQKTIRGLAQLGVLLGAVVQVQRAAPLGGPILVEANGSRVAIGRSLARKVLVRVLP